MPKSKKKDSKTKASSKLTLKGPRRSPSPLLSKDVEDINVDGFEDIDAVDLTREGPARAPVMFLIHWTVFLDKAKQYSNAKMIDPTDFDYPTFLANEQVRLEEKTRPKGYRVRRQQVRAGLSSSGVRKQDTMVLDLEDVEGWANLEAILLAWHEGKKKSIQVSIDIKFARRTAPKPVQDFSTDDNESESSEEEEAPSQKKKRTATDKHRVAMKEREKLELELDNHVGQLMRRWQCGNVECKNKDGKCLVLKGKHHALNSNHFTVWNKAISNGQATIESPPLRVLHMLDRPSSSTSKPAPQPAPPPAPPSTPSSSSAPVHVHMGQAPSMSSMSPMPSMLMQSPWQYPSLYMPPPPYLSPSPYLPPYQHPYAAPPPPPPPQYPMHYPMHPPHPPSPQLPPNPPPKPAPQPPHRSPPLRPVSREKESSPVSSDGTGPMELLYQYIEWFKKRVPEYSTSLEDAYKQLRDQLYNVEQIRKAEVQDWRELDIPLGLGKQLKKRVREWDKERRATGGMGERTDAVNSLMQLATVAEFLES